MSDRLRAKFKTESQLAKDTAKFKEGIFCENCKDLHDKLEIILDADNQLTGFGIIDVELYLQNNATGALYYINGNSAASYIKFDSDKEKIKDTIVIDFKSLSDKNCIEDKMQLIKSFKSNEVFKVMVKVTSPLEDVFKLNYSDFSVFNELCCRILGHYKKEVVELINYDFNDDWLHDLVEVAKIIFNPIGKVEVISGAGHIQS